MCPLPGFRRAEGVADHRAIRIRQADTDVTNQDDLVGPFESTNPVDDRPTRELSIEAVFDGEPPVPKSGAGARRSQAVPRPAPDSDAVESLSAAFVPAPRRYQVRAARRLQARKVGRLVRHIELYSLVKVSLLFYTCMLLVGVVAGVMIWSMFQRSGAVSSIEGFVGEIFLFDSFHLEGRQIFRIGVLGGMVGVLVLTLVTLVGGALFNLISDLTGGIRVSVVELETARPAPARRTRL